MGKFDPIYGGQIKIAGFKIRRLRHAKVAYQATDEAPSISGDVLALNVVAQLLDGVFVCGHDPLD